MFSDHNNTMISQVALCLTYLATSNYRDIFIQLYPYNSNPYKIEVSGFPFILRLTKSGNQPAVKPVFWTYKQS